MAVVEAGVFAAARAVVRTAAGVWLTHRRAAAERSSDLAELVATSVSDSFRRRSLERQLEEIVDAVARRLEELLRYEFEGVAEHDRAAVLAHVVDVFAGADLSDEAMFAVDMSAVKLAAGLRAGESSTRFRETLGERPGRLLDLLLTECCTCFIQLVMQLPSFAPRATAENLDRLGRLGEQIALILARLPPPRLDTASSAETDRDFERRYLQVVSVGLDELELFGVDMHRFRPRSTLSVAYISLSVTSHIDTAQARDQHRRTLVPGGGSADRWFAAARHDDDAGTVRVEAALSTGSRVLIRGEAGSGKTTLLSWLAVTAARERFTGPLRRWNGCVPFVVKLRRHAESALPAPEQFLDATAAPIAGLMPDGWVHRLLDTGRALLLVDGVDELPPGRRRAVREWLAGLVRAYPATRVLVTARPGAATADWLAREGFAAVMLEPMGASDVRALVRHWHDAVRDAGNLPCPIDELARYEASLLARLDAGAHLRALATSPLLCAMLCALNLDRRTHLPRDRMSIYSAAVNLLLERRDAERGIPTADLSLALRDKISIVQDLAWRLSLNNRSELPVAQALDYAERKLATMPGVTAEAPAVLSHLLVRSGILRQPAADRVDFVHRTFQEYLTAKEIAEEAHVGLLLDRAHLDQWRNVVVLAAGHANSPVRAQLIGGLLDRAGADPRRARTLTVLAAACLETSPTVPADLRRRIDAAVATLVPPASMRETRLLAAIGEPVLRGLPRTLAGLGDASAAATVRLVALAHLPDAVDVLAEYATDARPRVQDELVHVWQYFDAHEYAERVLADAPLDQGRLLVTEHRFLSATRHLRHLTRLRVRLDGVEDLGRLAGARRLTEIWAENAQEVDIAPLAEHAALEFLALPGVRRVSGTATLATLRRLVALWLPAPEPLPDPSVLDDLQQLRDLWVGDIRPGDRARVLTGLRSLTMLNFAHNDEPLDPALLSRLSRLTFVGMRHAGGTPELRELGRGLARLPGLTDVGLWDCRDLTDLSILAGFPLTRLRLLGADALTDLRPVTRLANLRELLLQGCPAPDLTAIGALSALRVLNLDGCRGITDLSPLASLPRLRHLSLANAPAGTDLSPLAALRGLHLWLNPGQDVRGLDRLRGRVRLRWF
ncbi:MAG TPA: NACHT domain-containing protein [Pilimelia sp.]|nr:NACHT domain-containing protein [Pilimelia sp.]